MPIFEFLCRPCNTIFSFLSLSPQPGRDPVCPRCGSGGLERVPSSFAVSRKSADRTDGGAADAADEGRMAALEQEAMRMASELDESEAEDPRVMARMMRRLAEASGERITPTMEEMFRRMEAGEDPDELEDELGPLLEEEMESEGVGDAGSAPPPTRDDGLYSF